MTPLSAQILIQPGRTISTPFVNRLRGGAQGGARDGSPAAPQDLIGLSSRKERNELEMVFSYDGWRKDAKRAEELHREYPSLVPEILDKMRRKQQVHSGDRSHKYIRKLDALTPTLSYDGWEDDARKVEWPETGHLNFRDPAEKMLEVMRTKQAEHSGDRSHANLRELDQLKAALDYEGWSQDAERAEEQHRRGYPSLVPEILDKMRRKQQVHSGDRSHKYIRKLDALTPTLSYDGWEDDARKVEWPETGHLNFRDPAEKMLEVMRTKQAEHSGDRSHANLRELDQLKAALDYEGWSQDAERAEEQHRRGYSSLVPEILDKMRHKQQVHSGDRSHANLRELDELVAHLARNMQAPAPSAPQGSTSAVLWDADTLPTPRLIGAVLAGKSCALSCLGLQPHLTHPRKTIRARFRVLAIRLHPDKETHPQATAAFVKVRAAHDRLMASE